MSNTNWDIRKHYQGYFSEQSLNEIIGATSVNLLLPMNHHTKDEAVLYRAVSVEDDEFIILFDVVDTIFQFYQECISEEDIELIGDVSQTALLADVHLREIDINPEHLETVRFEHFIAPQFGFKELQETWINEELYYKVVLV